MSIGSINPATGDLIKTFGPLADAEIEAKVQQAAAAFQRYLRTTFAERAEKMLAVAEILDAEQEDFALVMTTEMGKTYNAALAEAAKSATGCRYYAENAGHFLADEEIRTEATRSYVRYQPLGVVLAIMPWNFPFWQVFRFAAPALMAGNVAMLKHASNVPQCALLIEDIFRRAGFEGAYFKLSSLVLSKCNLSSQPPHRRCNADRQRERGPAGRKLGGPADQENSARTRG